MARVQIEQVHKSFGKVRVLQGVSVDVADGEMMVLVGPSGCGKSTLLRTVAGLEDLSSGQILIGARPVTHLPPKDRDVAMVFQNYALYPHLTVRENMAFSLRLRRMAASELAARVERAAGLLGLEPLLDRLPRQLSGGQRQRVAMGRAIVRDPQVFLFDEPLSNLDAHLRVAMRAEIKALHQRLGATMIYVTHDQIEAMTMADRIVVLRDGRIEQIGEPLELYDRPANTFVAGFIGSPAMNLLPARLQPGGVAALLDDAPHCAPLPVAVGTAAGDATPVRFGIRPEHLRLADDGPLACEVQVVEPTGGQTQLVLRCGAHALTAWFAERITLRPGDAVRLAFDAGREHVFAAATGLRLA